MPNRKGPPTEVVALLLTPRQIKKLDTWAERKGTSRAAIARQLVDKLGEPPPPPIVLAEGEEYPRRKPRTVQVSRETLDGFIAVLEQLRREMDDYLVVKRRPRKK